MGPPQQAPPQPDPADSAPPPRNEQQENYQLRLPKSELDRLASRVQTDYRNALSDHNKRITRWREYYRRWRAIANTPAMGEEGASNVPVPYIRWNVFTKWSKEMDALFGDDAEITAVPVGPSDFRKDKKISRYMTWRVFNSMKLTNKFCEFVLRKIVFGRSFAYSPWKRETFEVPADKGKSYYECIGCGTDTLAPTGKPPAKCPQCGGKLDTEPKDTGTLTDYEGPGFQPLWPDDLIVPAEEVDSIHDFSFVVRRYRVRPDDLLQGEDEGRYQGITENWAQIVNLAQRGQQRESEGEEIKKVKDDAEGIMYQRPSSSGEWVTILEWYGRWRPLKKGVGKKGGGSAKDASEWDFEKREMREKQYVVRFLWDLRLVVGVQDLETLYPKKKNKRPFVESSMLKAGEYWSPGLAEMLIDIEDELSVNHNQATGAGQLAMNPPIGYRPASGFNPETFKLEPGMAIPLDNPQTDLKQITITANMELATWKEQTMLAYGEKLTGMSDLQMGRQSDRPNAPRTATQTVKLLEEGNVRISLDTKVLREDMAEILSHFWDLEYEFSPEQTFFRVTEEDAGGLFPVNNGGSMLTYQDRDGRYDFRLQFANSIWSKEAKKEQSLARYQLDLQNPLIMQNPRALWQVTKEAHEALGDPNFASMVPEPEQPDLPVPPMEEWNRLLQGEDIHVNPLDNDQLHLIRHMRDLKEAESDPNADPDAQKKMVDHYRQHIMQLQQKKIQQAIIEQAVQAAAQLASGGALAFPHGLFGPGSGIAKGKRDGTTAPAGNPAAQDPRIYSGHPEGLHGNS